MTPGAIKESAKVSFSLSFLLQLVGVLMAGVWGYSQLDARISTIANASAQHTDGIARIEDSMEKNQDAPISSDHIQNTKLNWLESVNTDVLKRLDRMEMRIFEMRNGSVDDETVEAAEEVDRIAELTERLDAAGT